ncbi:MAG: hypothetical protein ACOY3P_01690 [Planctomycetota bacterium]
MRAFATVFLLILVGLSTARADDAFYVIPLTSLELTDGKLPAPDNETPSWMYRNERWQRMLPYAVLDGAGEVYVGLTQDAFTPEMFSRFRPTPDADAVTDKPARSIAVRAPAGKEVSGRLYMPQGDWKGMVKLRFRIAPDKAEADSRRAFFEAKRAHYGRLAREALPGSPWFRHQASLAHEALGRSATAATRAAAGQWNRYEIERTFSLLSGGRAVAENLQLDRLLPERGANAKVEFVDVTTIEGIRIQEFDWTELTRGKSPSLDPLAQHVPADQHAVFFPNVPAALKLASLLQSQGTVVLRVAEPTSQTVDVVSNYTRQLALPLDRLAKELKPEWAASLALTGSDPHFATGTDVALLFETSQPAELRRLLIAFQEEAMSADPAAKRDRGEIAGLKYRGVITEDRRLSSYLARWEDVVVVTNSLGQLERLAAVKRGDAGALADLPEYRFFRDRYPLSASDESALLILSDATIRRWCGPQWRILASRRLRALSAMVDFQAEQFDRYLGGEAALATRTWSDPLKAVDDELLLGPEGVRSQTFGTLGFMTPIVELKCEKVTSHEAEMYRRWREGYERNWTWAFDPIALRLGVSESAIDADLTVMPLIAGSAYREFLRFTRDGELKPGSGDPHGALAHFVLAVDPKGPEILRQATPVPGIDTQWLGRSVALYVDDDPIWKKIASTDFDELDELMKKEGWKLPVALHAEVSSGLKLTAFLVTIRGLAQQAAPGMTDWQTLEHEGEPYVKITPTARARGEIDELGDVAICYYASGDAFVFTLNEDLLKRSIERQVARRKAAESAQSSDKSSKGENEQGTSAGVATTTGWLGRHVGMQLDVSFLQTAAAVFDRDYQARMQTLAWSNLPVLNDWRRGHPEIHAEDIYARYWKSRLICPGGGEYVWNDAWQTYESTVYGHPGEPKEGPKLNRQLEQFRSAAFGITFEHDGLRARAQLQRRAAD